MDPLRGLMGFITIRFYITLKRCDCPPQGLHRFITIRFYITLKPWKPINGRRRSFITIRFYITLKPSSISRTTSSRFITIRFYITLKPQTSNLRIDTLQYQESLYPYYTTRQQSESITTLFATFNLSFRSKQSR